MRKERLVAIIAAVLLLVLVSGFAVQAAPNAASFWKVMSAGGGNRNSAGYRLSDTSGQAAIGVSQASQYRLQAGFWPARAAGIPPEVTGISPSFGLSGTRIDVTITGTDFRPGAAVKLSQAGLPEIFASNVNLVSETQLTCSFDLTAAGWGSYDVVVTNPGWAFGTLPAGFIVRTQPAVINGISPACGVTGTSVNVTLTGSGFIAGSTIRMEKAGVPNIMASNVVITPDRITCSFNLTAAAIGSWA